MNLFFFRNFLFLGFTVLNSGHEYFPTTQKPNVVCFLYTIWTQSTTTKMTTTLKVLHCFKAPFNPLWHCHFHPTHCFAKKILPTMIFTLTRKRKNTLNDRYRVYFSHLYQKKTSCQSCQLNKNLSVIVKEFLPSTTRKSWWIDRTKPFYPFNLYVNGLILWKVKFWSFEIILDTDVYRRVGGIYIQSTLPLPWISRKKIIFLDGTEKLNTIFKQHNYAYI